MELGYVVGWLGVCFGLLVPLPQLIKIFKTKRLADVSLGTYTFLICCLTCYLIHALYIGSAVFATAQCINLTTNGFIWALLMLNRFKGEKWSRKHLKKLADYLPTKSLS